jgi:hypothetical protein
MEPLANPCNECAWIRIFVERERELRRGAQLGRECLGWERRAPSAPGIAVQTSSAGIVDIVNSSYRSTELSYGNIVGMISYREGSAFSGAFADVPGGKGKKI